MLSTDQRKLYSGHYFSVLIHILLSHGNFIKLLTKYSSWLQYLLSYSIICIVKYNLFVNDARMAPSEGSCFLHFFQLYFGIQLFVIILQDKGLFQGIRFWIYKVYLSWSGHLTPLLFPSIMQKNIQIYIIILQFLKILYFRVGWLPSQNWQSKGIFYSSII